MESQSEDELNRLLTEWRRHMAERGISDESTLDELESHLLEQMDHLLESGLAKREAFLEAAARLGHDDLLASEYRKVKDLPDPKREPAKTLAWSGALAWSYFVMASRQLRRHKGYALINLAGLAISLASGLLLFRYVASELSYDRFPEESDRIYRLLWEEEVSGAQAAAAIVPGKAAQVLLDEIPEVEASTRLMELDAVTVLLDDEVFRGDRSPMVDANFLEFFGYRMLEGDRSTALTEPNSVVMTKKTSEKYFGVDSPVGKEMELSSNWFRKSSFRVTGVVEDPPTQTSYPFGMLVSYTTAPESERTDWAHTFIRLREGADRSNTDEKIEALSFELVPQAASKTKPGFHLGLAIQHISDIHFNPTLTREYAPAAAGNERRVFTLLAIGIFVVLIACVNYVNISTAGAATRAREVGMRRLLGSSRGNLIRQHLAESLLLVLGSFLFAVAAAELFLPLVEQSFGMELPSATSYGPHGVVLLAGFALLIWLIAGTYPAFFISRWKPVSLLNGRAEFGGRRSGLRNALVVGQFTASIIMIVGSILVSQQVRFMKTKDVGFDKEHVFAVDWMYRLRDQAVFRDEVKKLPGVVDAGFGWPLPPFTDMINNHRYVSLYTDSSLVNLDDERGTGGFFVYTANADERLIPTLDIKMAMGRNFDPNPGPGDESVILNETAVQRLGLEDPIGRVFYGRRSRYIQESSKYETYVGRYEVIGVVEDFNFSSLYENVEPMGFLPSTWGSTLAVRVAPGHTRAVVEATQALWNRMMPIAAMEYFFIDEQFDATFRVEDQFGKATTFFTWLAILIACLGIVGLAAFTAQRRRREIGIRKVLGATARSVVTLLSREFMLLVAASFIIAVPLAYFGLSRWLDNFAYRISIGPAPFVLAGVAALGLALIAVSFHALRAAAANPADTLRSD